jgi:hypothetical protein
MQIDPFFDFQSTFSQMQSLYRKKARHLVNLNLKTLDQTSTNLLD